jgi:hypothetical protein
MTILGTVSNATCPEAEPSISAEPDLGVGRLVLRRPDQLRLPAILEEFGFLPAEELNYAAELKGLSIPEPIVITSNNTILTGFGAWKVALFERKAAVQCLEYSLPDESVLPFVLRYHQPRRGWNPFVRISMANKLKSVLQEKALENMRAGGKNKGLTNLPKADRINVRQQIAKIAGTGTGNVAKVETILAQAHPSIFAALQNGFLSIHKGWQWCKLSKTEQKEQFALYEERRTLRSLLNDPSVKKQKPSYDFAEVIEALQRTESRSPGSVTVRAGVSAQCEILLGKEVMALLDQRGPRLLA